MKMARNAGGVESGSAARLGDREGTEMGNADDRCAEEAARGGGNSRVREMKEMVRVERSGQWR